MQISIRSIRFLSLLIAFGVGAAAAKADTSIYSDGAPNGTYEAWNIDYGIQVENSFVVSSSSTLTGVTFANWLLVGDTASTVDWAIVGSEGSQTPVCGGCSGTASLTAIGDFAVTVNPGEFEGVEQSFSLPGLNLAAGTYWLELQNEVTGDGVGGWDMDGGPSSVWNNVNFDESGSNCNEGVGPGTCSNSFTIYGPSSTGVTPEPSSLALLFSGVTLIGAEVRRRRLI